MKMLDALTRGSSAVGDYAEAVFKAELLGEPGYDLEDMRNYGGISGVYLSAGADVLSGDNEEMPRRLRVYVVEGIDEVVGVNAA